MCDKPKSVRNFRNPNHKTNTSDRIYTLYQQQRLCDLDIILNNQRFHVHSNILAAASEYFDLKLVENLETASLKTISLDNLNHDATQRAIDYCYTGEIEISYDSALEVLAVAGLFQLEPVVNACCEFMIDIIDTTNCLDFHEIASLHGCITLNEKVTDFIIRNYKKVTKSKKFLKISIDHLEHLLHMNLNVSSETEIFYSVKTWISYDLPKRKNHLASLLKLIKLPSLSDELIFDEVQPLCEGVLNCQQLILSALQWKHSPSSRFNAGINWDKTRSPISTIIVCGCWWPETVSKIDIYNPNDNNWSEFLDTNIKRKNTCYVLIGDELIAMGGQDDKIHATVESINLKTGKKVTLPPLKEARVSAVATLIGDVIYIFGGYNGSKVIGSVEKWDPITRIWSLTTPMKIAREACGIAVLDNEIYIIGGWNYTDTVNDIGFNIVETFCPLTEKWRMCAPMNESRLWVAAATVDDKIYAIGGRRGNDFQSSHKYKSVECYDKKTNSWSFVSDLSSARHGVAAGILGNDLVAVGGVDLISKKFTSVEKYDANLNKWKTLKSLSANRDNAVVLSVPISWLDRKLTLN